MHSRAKIADAFGGGYDNNSSSGGSSPPCSSNSESEPTTSSESDGSSSSADEFSQRDLREFKRHVSGASTTNSSAASASGMRFFDPSSRRSVSESSSSVIDDIDKHQQRMLLLLPAFSSSSSSSSSASSDDGLSRWLAGFDVGWVLDMNKSESSLPRREVGRRVRVWTQALSTMERVFRLRHRQLADAQVACLGKLAVASARAMLKLPDAVAALDSSPSKLLAALDVYVPVSETFPVLARMFSWGPSHPVSAAVETTLAGLVDAVRRCGRDDLRAFVRSYYPWRMPQGGEVHPCVGFWMGYFRCMLRNRITLYFLLGDEGGGGGGGLSLMAELIASLETVLEEKSAALAFPGLRQVFMLNNTFAIVRRAVRSDLKLFLPPEWVRVREQRMEGYVKGYVEASWAAVVSRLDGGAKPLAAVLRRRTTSGTLGAFYSAVENACRAQRCWKVPSPVLRGILRKTVSENVVPAYRRYLEDHPEVEVASERTAEELEQQLSDLFEG